MAWGKVVRPSLSNCRLANWSTSKWTCHLCVFKMGNCLARSKHWSMSRFFEGCSNWRSTTASKPLRVWSRLQLRTWSSRHHWGNATRGRCRSRSLPLTWTAILLWESTATHANNYGSFGFTTPHWSIKMSKKKYCLVQQILNSWTLATPRCEVRWVIRAGGLKTVRSEGPHGTVDFSDFLPVCLGPSGSASLPLLRKVGLHLSLPFSLERLKCLLRLWGLSVFHHVLLNQTVLGSDARVRKNPIALADELRVEDQGVAGC